LIYLVVQRLVELVVLVTCSEEHKGSVALTERSCVGMLRPHAEHSTDARTGSCSLGVRGVSVPT
jgi:hypothetical protein